MNAPDAVVVGGGPNGLAAAIELARAGHPVTLLERAEAVGGGIRSAERTLPGFIHDVCSAIHPFGEVRPRPIAEKKNPADISAAATSTPVCASQTQKPVRFVAPASTRHTIPSVTSTPAWA